MTLVLSAASAAPDDSLWDQPLGSAVMTTLLGFCLLAVGVPVALDWRGAAESYTRLTDLVTPRLRRLHVLPPVDEGARWHRLVRQNRIILAVFAVFGVFFFAGGVISLFRHLG